LTVVLAPLAFGKPLYSEIHIHPQLTHQDLRRPPEEEVLEFPGPDVSWEAEWREFVSAIRESREPLANGYDGW